MSEGVVQGTVHVIEDTKSYGQNGFRKRLVVLEQETGRFTNFVPVEFVQDACDSVDELTVGDNVEIRYRLNGRKWQKDSNSEVKFFLNAEALGFKLMTKSSTSDAGAAKSGGDEEQPVYEDGDADIPF